MNVFDRKITVWRNTYRTANNKCEVPLMQFLKAGIDYLPTIMYLRQLYDYMVQSYSLNPAASATAEEQYREGKKNLPLATIGGTFANGGLREDLSEATNLLCLDIDATKPRKAAQLKAEGKEVPNEWVNDWEALKWKLSKLPFVAYCALSVGGHGIYLIIPIEDYHHHAEAWESLQHLFSKHLNLTIDAATKDITRPRFISYDAQPYLNEDAEIFRIKLREHRTATLARSFTSPRTARSSTEEAVRKCVDEIERRSLDITSDYSQWIDIASALFNELGEAGKQYFERISRFYPQSNEKDIEYKWQKNKNRSKVGVGTFFDICSRYGIRFRDPPCERPLTKANRHSPPKSEETTIIYKRTPLFPESIWADMTESEFNSILSPDAVSHWQAAHHRIPF